jgi:hypothetical protein
MPPRHAYWTILIDNQPTAFRAREQEELLPTLNQLKRKNTNAEMKWFARGRLWDTQELERDDFQRRKRAAAGPYERSEGKPPAGAPGSDAPRRRDHENRGKDWRPGGAHTDPRDRFKKKNRPDRTWSESGGDRKPWSKPAGGPPRGDRPWANKPAATGDRKPWSKPAGGPPRGDRPWTNRPPTGKRPWSGKPPGGGQPWRERPRPETTPTERRDADRPSTRPKEPTPPPASEQIRTKPKPPERG